MFGVRHGVVLHGVGFTQFGRGRTVAEQALIMSRHVVDGDGTIAIECDGLACGLQVFSRILVWRRA